MRFAGCPSLRFYLITMLFRFQSLYSGFGDRAWAPGQRLERLCRYITRSARCLERLTLNDAGKIVYELKHPFRDGTTQSCSRPPYDSLGRAGGNTPETPTYHVDQS